MFFADEKFTLVVDVAAAADVFDDIGGTVEMATTSLAIVLTRREYSEGETALSGKADPSEKRRRISRTPF